MTTLEVNSEPLNETFDFSREVSQLSSIFIREQYNSIVRNTIIITVLVYIKSSFQLPSFHSFITCNYAGSILAEVNNYTLYTTFACSINEYVISELFSKTLLHVHVYVNLVDNIM